MAPVDEQVMDRPVRAEGDGMANEGCEERGESLLRHLARGHFEFAMAGLAILFTASWLGVARFIAMARDGERMYQAVHFVDGLTDDPESLCRMGLFSDAELKALIAEKDRRPDPQTAAGRKRIEESVAKIRGLN